MRINFKISLQELNEILKEENKKICQSFLGGKKFLENSKKTNRGINVALGLLMIFGGMAIIDVAKYASYLVAVSGVLLIIQVVVQYFKGDDKKEFNKMIEDERGKAIIHRNRLVLGEYFSESLNYEEIKDKEIEVLLDINNSFFEFSFGDVKKIYRREALKKVELKDGYLSLKFSNIKYYIGEKYLENGQALLESLKGEVQSSEIQYGKEVLEKPKLEDYLIKNNWELDIKSLGKRIGRKIKKKAVNDKLFATIGLIGLGIGVIGVINTKMKIFLIAYIGGALLLQATKKIDYTIIIEKAEGIKKFKDNLSNRKFYLQKGEVKTYFYIGDEITVLKNKDIEIVGDEKLQIKFKDKEWLVLGQKEKSRDLLTEFAIKTYRDEDIKNGDRTIEENVKSMIKLLHNKKVVVSLSILAGLILTIGDRKIEGIGLIGIGYLIARKGCDITNKSFRKRLDKLNLSFKMSKEEFEKYCSDITFEEHEKNGIDELKIEVYTEKTLVESKIAGRISVIDNDRIKINDDYIDIGKEVIVNDKIDKKDLEIMKTVKGKLDYDAVKKDITFKGRLIGEMYLESTRLIKRYFRDLFIMILMVVGFISASIAISIKMTFGITLGIVASILCGLIYRNVAKMNEEQNHSPRECYIEGNIISIGRNEIYQYNLKDIDMRDENGKLIILFRGKDMMKVDIETMESEKIRELKNRIAES